ncbi:MAG: hypothetical protein ABI747_01060 [Candidatus Moraniibacteriota bacterium]
MSRPVRLKIHAERKLIVMECGNCNREVFNVLAYFLFCRWKKETFLVGDISKSDLCWDCHRTINIPKIFKSRGETETETRSLTVQIAKAPDIDEWFPFVRIVLSAENVKLADTLTRQIDSAEDDPKEFEGRA